MWSLLSIASFQKVAPCDCTDTASWKGKISLRPALKDCLKMGLIVEPGKSACKTSRMVVQLATRLKQVMLLAAPNIQPGISHSESSRLEFLKSRMLTSPMIDAHQVRATLKVSTCKPTLHLPQSKRNAQVAVHLRSDLVALADLIETIGDGSYCNGKDGVSMRACVRDPASITDSWETTRRGAILQKRHVLDTGHALLGPDRGFRHGAS
jgi:hypothetical protein